ncbi:MAG: hypothetical protein AB8C84_04860 [Oligoflexales bacterium]
MLIKPRSSLADFRYQNHFNTTPSHYWKSILISQQDADTILGILNGEEQEPGWPICIQHSEKPAAIYAAQSLQEDIVNRSQFNQLLIKAFATRFLDIFKNIEPLNLRDEAISLYIKEWHNNMPPHSQKKIKLDHINFIASQITSDTLSKFDKQAQNIEISEDFENFTLDYFDFIYKVSNHILKKTDIDHIMPTLILFLSSSFSPEGLAKITVACEASAYWAKLESGLLCYFTHLQAATFTAIQKKEYWSKKHWHKEIYELF